MQEYFFFGENPSKFIPQHEIKVARFQGTDKVNIIDSEEMKFPFVKLINEVEKFIKKHTNTYQRIEGFNRIDIQQYPMEAIREGLINAIAHRDYKIKYSSISVFIFKDRIEITSPGKLIPPVTINSIQKNESYYAHRNKKICELFHRINLMEQYGTGISKIQSTMEQNGLKKAKFKEGEQLFKTIFYGHEYNSKKVSKSKNTINLKELGLNSRQIKALELILNDSKLFTTTEYGGYFNVSPRTALRDLNKLVDEGFIFKYYSNGNKKNGFYGLKSNMNF
ncbi:MAG: DeoR family transcriptional regulator [Methanobrevibacter sp.]|jgi:ATP-dependent DNA helicase RecG|nr:DeoR family transcriptional regulator [Candidatus Methanovirga meridionalis]